MQVPKQQSCQGCMAFACDGRSVGDGPPMADIVFLGGSPKEDVTYQEYVAFKDGVGTLFKKILGDVMRESPQFINTKVYYTYAVQCVVETEKVEIVKHCAPLAHRQIYNTGAQVVVPLGTTALRSLGMPQSVKEVRGKVLKTRVNGKSITCVPTYNPGILFKKESTGLLETFKSDLRTALRAIARRNVVMPTIEELTKDYMLAKTNADSLKILDAIKADWDKDELPVLAVDTETPGLNTHDPDFKMIAISFAWGPGKAAAMLWDHREKLDDWRKLIEPLREVLAGPNKKVFHNFKFDFKVLDLVCGFKIAKVGWDTMCGEYLIDENKKGLYNLDSVVRVRVPEFTDYKKMIKGSVHKSAVETLTEAKDRAVAEHKQLVAEGKALAAAKKAEADKGKRQELTQQQAELKVRKDDAAAYKKTLTAKLIDAIQAEKDSTFEDKDVDTLLLYAAIDTDCTLRVCKQQVETIKKESANLLAPMRNIMVPASRVLGRMEHEGIRVDTAYLEVLEKDFLNVISVEEDILHRIVGRPWDINSTKQLIDILTNEMGLRLTKKTKKGNQLAIDAQVLDGLKGQHPIIEHLSTYRKAYKAAHTFLKGIKEKCQIDGRVHAGYNLTTTATGRLSSAAPNMQNFPSSILGRNIKKLFIADNDDEVFVNLDYSGAEVRVLTAYASDQGLIDTLNQGLGIHSYVASKVFGIPYEELEGRKKYAQTDPARYKMLDTKRQTGKRTVFLTIYGGGALKLHQNLVEEGEAITLEECEKIIQTFLAEFPIIETYMQRIKNDVDRKGYIESKFGRRRRFPLAGLDWKLRNASYREGINMPIQSTSSDLVVDRLIELDEHREETGIKLRITVHDSIGFSFPKSRLAELRGTLDYWTEQRITEKYKWMPVPFIYEADYGPSYGECYENIK